MPLAIEAFIADRNMKQVAIILPGIAHMGRASLEVKPFVKELYKVGDEKTNGCDKRSPWCRRRLSDKICDPLDGGYFLPAFFRAAHRAFISSESLFRPAAVIPPLFPAAVLRPVLPLAFCFAQRARAAADNLARVAADIPRLPLLDVNRVEVPPRIETSRLSRVFICRRIKTASSKALRDKSIHA
jgi:hypothetical protein